MSGAGAGRPQGSEIEASVIQLKDSISAQENALSELVVRIKPVLKQGINKELPKESVPAERELDSSPLTSELRCLIDKVNSSINGVRIILSNLEL